MKKLIIVCICISCISQKDLIAQDDSFSRKLPFFEVKLSLNKTRDIFGGGISILMQSPREKSTKMVFGIEYNSTVYKKSSIYYGHFSSLEDIEFKAKSVSFPFLIRGTIGKKYKLILEAGPSVDFIPEAIEKGTEVTWTPMGDTIVRSERKVSRVAEEWDGLDFAINSGIGVKIPFNNFGLVININYHYGFTDLLFYGGSLYLRYGKINFGLYF